MEPATPPLVTRICTECGAPMEFQLGALQVHCSVCQAGLAIDKGLRLVRLDCPRCGGNFYYIDGTLSSRCPFCSALLLALSHNRLLRYVIRPVVSSPAEAPHARLLFLPFWHMSALVYGWDIGSHLEIDSLESYVPHAHGDPAYPSSSSASFGTILQDSGPLKAFRGRVVSFSLPDPATLTAGVTSLRLRADVFPLEPFNAKHETLGEFLPATLTSEQAKAELLSRVLLTGKPTEGMKYLDCQRQDLVAENISLYYYPFWVRPSAGTEKIIWDGVTGCPEPLTPLNTHPTYRAATAFDELKIVELTCASCGTELPTGNHSIVFHCSNCGQFWTVTRDGLRPFSASFAKPRSSRDPAKKLLWLPYWRIEARVGYGGKEAATVSDLQNVLGLLSPRTEIPLALPDSPLAFFVAAYGGFRAPKMDVAARDMTRFQPQLKPCTFETEDNIYTCFLPSEDAQKLAYVTWIPLLPGVIIRLLRSLRIQTGQAQLWYIPFADCDLELISLLTNTRYDRSAFRGLHH